MSYNASSKALFRLATTLVVAAAVSGCGPTKVETETVSELEKSLADLRAQVDPTRRRLLNESLALLVGGEAKLNDEALTAYPDLVLELYRPIAGMTAEEIIETALQTRLLEVQLIIAELEEKLAASVQATNALEQFTLETSRVFKRNRGFLEWPVIELKAGNDTEHQVWLIHFRAALLRPGDPEPWLIEEFDQLVLNGLEPGERALWRIEPEQEEWVTLIEPHPNLQFTLEVMRLEGLGGTVIAATEWGEIEDLKLALYRQKLETIRKGNSLALDDRERP